MSDDDANRIKALEDRLAKAEKKLEEHAAKILPWSHVQFSAESGGGDVQMGVDNVILRPFSSTPAGSR